MSQRNCNYNKHRQVELSAYVQASKVNDPNNIFFPRKLDGIYLCPATNFQGGHQNMDLPTGQLIKIPKVVYIPITYVVINAAEKWRRRRDLSHQNFII